MPKKKKDSGEPLGEFCISFAKKAKKVHKGDENLVHFTSTQSRGKAVENGKKGGIASGVAKREKKLLKEVAQEILWRDMGGGVSGQQKLIDKIYEMATSDSEKVKLPDVIKALEVLRDTAGQSPTQKSEITGADGAPLQPLIFQVPECFNDERFDGKHE